MKQFKLASVNLFNYLSPPNAYYDFENIYSQEQWQKKQAWLKAFLDRQQVDIIGFQEVFSIQALKSLCENHGYKYFSVVDEPEVENDFIFTGPVVALASRFPVIDSQVVKVSNELANSLQIKAFDFSRKVLRATIVIPEIGLCDCYVVHLKSKRADLASDLGNDNVENLSSSAALLVKQALGRWVSDKQRGDEAALLYHAMLERRENTDNAMILMGDFNDSLSSSLLNPLNVQRSDIHNSDIKLSDLAHLPEYAINKSFNYYQLHDAYELYAKHFIEDKNQQRASTHYFGNQGSVIDYILLSDEFNTDNSASLAEVNSYITYDRHLTNPEYDIDSHSTDHAPVIANIKIRS